MKRVVEFTLWSSCPSCVLFCSIFGMFLCARSKKGPIQQADEHFSTTEKVSDVKVKECLKKLHHTGQTQRNVTYSSFKRIRSGIMNIDEADL